MDEGISAGPRGGNFLQIENHIFDRDPVCMEPGRMCSFRGVSHGKQRDGRQSLHLGKLLQKLFRIKHADIRRSQAQIRRLQHHLRHRDHRVDLAVVLSFIFPFLGNPGVISHHQHLRSVKMHRRAGVRFLQRLL